MDEQDLDRRIRAVLIQLAMTSNGAVAKMDANSGGGYYQHVVLEGWLDPLDAPQHRYLELYLRETTNDGRDAVVKLAEEELDRIRYSKGHAGVAETLDELFDRIVALGEGWEVNDVAIALRTTGSIVRRARRERGRETEKGKPVEDSSGLGAAERRQRVNYLKGLGRSAREISHALGIPYSTVLRDLGRKT